MDGRQRVRGGQPGQGASGQLRLRCHHDTPAVEQRHPQFERGGVEGVRGVEEDAPGADAVPARVHGECRDVVVGGRDALGRARRSGGVHHVQARLRRHPNRERRGREVPQEGFPQRLLAAHDQRGGGVLQQVPHPLGRVGRVHRYGQRPGLGDAQQGDDQSGGPGQHDADAVARCHSPGAQVPGEPVRPCVELRVREGVGPRDDRVRVREAGGDLREPCGDGRARGGLPAGVHLGEQPGLLAVEQDAGLAHPQRRVRGEPGEDRGEPGGQQGGRLPVEEFRVVPEPAVDSAGPAVRAVAFGEVEVEVEEAERQVVARRLDADPLRYGGQAGQVPGGAGRVLHDQQHLEQRVAGQRAVRVEHADEVFEGQVLVGLGGTAGGADPSYQVGEGGVPGEVRAQDQRVGHEPDQVPERRVGPSVDRGTDGDVVPGAQAREQDGERGPHDRERGGVAVVRDLQQGPVGVRRDADRHRTPLVPGLGGTRPVAGQVQLGGQARQGLAPVGELPPVHTFRVLFGAQQFLLPPREVSVRDGQRRPLRRTAPRPGRVGT